jgi:hypothetical protein
MQASTEILERVATAAHDVRSAQVPRRVPTPHARQLLGTWIRTQALNVTRHAAALRPFRREEFGTAAAAPTPSHIEVVNDLIRRLREGLLEMTAKVTTAARTAEATLTTQNLQRVMLFKDQAHGWVRGIEKVWDFYFELFGQRQSQYADWLLSCDRIALDCYQDAFMGVGKAKSIPAPPPFAYMRTGFSPATYRRGIPLKGLGRQLNPFPLVQLPYHRLINPWTLGAVLHEISHNLQSDLGLSEAVPRAIARRLLEEKIPRDVVAVWVRWNRETFADLSGLLLGGPPIVGSLMDVIARSVPGTFGYNDRGPHPTPYIRMFLSIELLRRMGFPEQAARYDRIWRQIYPNPRAGTIPTGVLTTQRRVVPLVVDALCYQPFAELGDKPYSRVIKCGPKELQIMEEAAGRLAAGNDPGVVPERFLIGAARIALVRKLARPGVITKNFYDELARR